MTLTYKQDPKKYNPTIRLKRIEQRFNTGYRNIRRFKEDISNHLTTRVATKRVLNFPIKPLKIFENRRVFPPKKWNVLIKRAQEYGRVHSTIFKQQHPALVFRRFFGYQYKNAINLFKNTVADKRQFFSRKQDYFFSSFLAVAIRSFNFSFDFLLDKLKTFKFQNHFLIRRTSLVFQFNLQLKFLHKLVKTINKIYLPLLGTLDKKKPGMLQDVNKDLLKAKFVALKKIAAIQKKQKFVFNREVLAFRYGRLSKKIPSKLMSAQNQVIFGRLLKMLKKTRYNQIKKRIFQYISKPKKLIQIKPASIVPTNVFTFTTRSHGVLYRYMWILREKFGIPRYDIPFRIDTYLSAYEKRKRPTWFKTMCLSRSKIRLFYGQLTQKKIARLIKQTKAGFRGMFGVMERRLDVILVRSNFCKNIFTAQQLVRHGHILVNFKLMTNFFYSIRVYDVVTFKKREMEKLYKYMFFLKLKLNRLKFPPVPYLVTNYEYMYFYVKPIVNARKSVGFTAPLSHGFLAKF